ncbi:Arc family DNA-binding protein [Ciceribacter sp. RN22]|uniref:Arc family DNA-binding protein n=1 Tax=Ciceribacter sp. RN22 TaxID=2954932 RepID=UPI002093FA15|nr:Arc family DNA-binding protein [Ciceribacter sp. RN22]MCO6178832.1 Arc family DNA-binding protein [Ciceribacter sp. RN22]
MTVNRFVYLLDMSNVGICGMGVNKTATDQFQLRLPPGLRDRIKTYAEAHGRSMNTEIVRVLEREFPEPWGLESRVTQLLGLTQILGDASADEAVTHLKEAIYETVKGIATGRVQDVDDETREKIRERLMYWEAEEAKDDHNRQTADMDDSELDTLHKHGSTEKF